MQEVLGISREWSGAVLFDKLVNAMKTAIVLSDKVTTVSKTYAHEIRHAYFGHGLHNILSENSGKLTGIVNGIDPKLFDPAKLAIPFKSNDLSGKIGNKRALQKALGLEIDPDKPIVAMITRFVAHKGLELVEFIGEERIRTTDMQLVVLGMGDARFEGYFRYLAAKYPGRVSANILFDGNLATRIYAGSDLFLMPSKQEPCGLSQLISMRYGTIPVVRETGGLVDTVPPYNPETGEGRGFTFQVFNAHDLFGAVKRALAVWRDEEKRGALVSGIMRADSSWKAPAAEYRKLYETIVS
jgi:starch synthase